MTYVELGAFLRELPEEYSIYAYSVNLQPGRKSWRPDFLTKQNHQPLQIFALESANVYPMLYMLINLRKQRVRPELVIWWLLLQGVVVAVLMSALWSYTTDVGGARHSVGAVVYCAW